MEKTLLLFQTHPEMVALKYFHVYEYYKNNPFYIISQKMFQYIYEKENSVWSLLDNVEKGQLIQHVILLSDSIIYYLINSENYQRIHSIYNEVVDNQQMTIQNLISKS